MLKFTTKLLMAGTCVLSCMLLPAAYAVQPQRFIHTQEADFEPGQVDGALVTSLGDIKLATRSSTIGELPDQVSILYDMQQTPDGTLYLAAGPQGKLLKRDGDSIVEVADLSGEQVFALSLYEGKLLVGISGEKSRVALLEDGDLVTLAELEDTRYIWDLLVPPAERFAGSAILAATGTEGKLLLIQPEREDPVSQIIDTQQTNILCLALDTQGNIILGTDEAGLVLRVEQDEENAYRAYALFDAPEPEIGTILIGEDGSIYVGTADAEQARPGRLEEAASEEVGHPEQQAPADEDDGEAPQEPGEIPGLEPEPEPVASPPQEASNKPTPDAAGRLATSSDPESQDDLEADGAGAPPTAEQYDRLRELIRDRLRAARKSGQLQAGPVIVSGVSSGPTSASRSRPVSAPVAEKEGNAVYRIDSQGFVHELFRDSVMILKLIEADGKLLAATGNEGQVFVIDPATRENAVLVDLPCEQILTMMLTEEGTTLIGTANPASLHTLGEQFAHKGTYTSPALDAAQISLWGLMSITADIPEGCSLAVETRSGNVQDPEQAAWSAWSSAQLLMPDETLPALAPKEIKVQSPPARFLQYRLTLTGTDSLTPVVDRVEVAYVTPNLPPIVSKITAAYPEPTEPDAPPATTMNIEWEATDDNQDALVYTLAYQPAGSDLSLVIGEDLTETSFEWETRRVPDGRYIIRVTASDKPNNPPDMAQQATRRTAPVVVDNSAPELTVDHTVSDGQVTISGNATDALSPVRAVEYTLDNDDTYHPILPKDLIFDSTSEAWSVTISDLSPGPHVLTLRAKDTRGNTVYRSVLFETP